jgi:hypothetical protein
MKRLVTAAVAVMVSDLRSPPRGLEHSSEEGEEIIANLLRIAIQWVLAPFADSVTLPSND